MHNFLQVLTRFSSDVKGVMRVTAPVQLEINLYSYSNVESWSSFRVFALKLTLACVVQWKLRFPSCFLFGLHCQTRINQLVEDISKQLLASRLSPFSFLNQEVRR